jgi:hypothetical protein
VVTDESVGAGTGQGDGSSFPASRAFVLQFSGDTTLRSPGFRGRIEHIDSGRARRFDSVDDLVAFVREFLAADETDERK